MVPLTTHLSWYVEEGREPGADSNEAGLRAMIEREQQFAAGPDEALSVLEATSGSIDPPVFLPATEDGNAVLVTALWDLNAGITKLRVGLFARDKGDLYARGWRLETHDGQRGDDHHMHHMQPIHSLMGPSAAVELPPFAMEPLGDGEPTMPLPATNPTELLACLLLGLYGRAAVLRYSSANGHILKSEVTRIMSVAGYVRA